MRTRKTPDVENAPDMENALNGEKAANGENALNGERAPDVEKALNGEKAANGKKAANAPETTTASPAEDGETPGKKPGRRKRRGKKPANAAGEMAVSGHLRELRSRLLVCAAVFVLALLGGLSVVRDVVLRLLALGEQYRYTFVYIAPQELLMEYFSVDLLLAAVVSLPVVLYEIWAFLRPGLKRNERLFCLLTMIFGLFFAALGVLFAYKILIPFMLRFLIALSQGSGVRASVSVQSYISFLLTLFLIFAAVFEMPVVTVLLTQLNILKVAWLKKARKIAIVAVFFVGALITPPDVVSQILVAVPLLGLYELSIFLCMAAAKLHKPVRTDEAETTAEQAEKTQTEETSKSNR